MLSLTALLPGPVRLRPSIGNAACRHTVPSRGLPSTPTETNHLCPCPACPPASPARISFPGRTVRPALPARPLPPSRAAHHPAPANPIFQGQASVCLLPSLLPPAPRAHAASLLCLGPDSCQPSHHLSPTIQHFGDICVAPSHTVNQMACQTTLQTACARTARTSACNLLV